MAKPTPPKPDSAARPRSSPQLGQALQQKPGLKRSPRRHFAFKDREYFSQNLALLLKSAVPIGQALDALAATSRTSSMKKAVAEMQANIEAGFSLADALERSRIVDSQTLALVRLGERSGRLVENLQLAAQQEEKRHTFRSKVRSALIYPIFVLSVTGVVGLGVAWFLLPRLSTTFTQLHAKLPFVSKVLIAFGQFLKLHGVVAVPIAIAVMALLAYIVFVAPGTRRIGQQLLFVLPGIGRLRREIEIAQFGYLLGTLLAAGLPVTGAVILLEKATNVPQYQQLYRYLASSLDDGFSFKESLTRYKRSSTLLPPAVQQIVIAGERSGSLSEVLLTIGRTYEQKADITTENLETILEPILLLFVAGGVLTVAVAVILPIYALIGGLNQ
ncbi:MAG TPA: type II secretion system F family protein [Candidatus Saccharimonadales bacterium]|nr:type II secretion system F family protein [Candidatus Saccharimonadales bacterium]